MPADRRQEILEAALECFNRAGYAATTLEEIRKRSGASTGSIYHFFSSKEDLAATLYLDAIRDYQGRAVAAVSEQRSAEEGIRRLIEVHLRWVDEHRELARFLFST